MSKEKIESLVNEMLSVKTLQIQNENERLKTEIKNKNIIIDNINKDHNKLLEEVNCFTNLHKLFINLQKLSTSKKYELIMSLFESTNNIINLSTPYHLLIEYWNDKDIILDLFKLLDIEIHPYIYDVKMPYEYDQDRLNDVLSYIVENGFDNMFSNNVDEWIEKCFQKDQYLVNEYIPLELFFKNPLLAKEENFKILCKIVNSLDFTYYGSIDLMTIDESKLDDINKNFLLIFSNLYLTLSGEQKLEILKCLLPHLENINLNSYITILRDLTNNSINSIDIKMWDEIYDKIGYNHFIKIFTPEFLPEKYKMIIMESYKRHKEIFYRMIHKYRNHLTTEQKIKLMEM